jgi:hypothetical protein
MVLPLIVAGAMAGAAGLSAMGKILGGVSAKSAAKRQAQIGEYNAQMDLGEAGLEAQLALEDDERTAAAAAVAAGAGGGGGLRGSALGVINDLGRQSLAQARAIAYRGQTAAWAARQGAKQDRFQGGQALTQGLLGAGSTVLGAAAKLYAAGG